MATYKVGYFVGSLSSTSINRELAKALIRLAPADLAFTEIQIRDLPLYSPDYDADFPPEARALKAAIPASVIGTSAGQIGTAMAQQSLRGVLSFCNARQMTAPEAYIRYAPSIFPGDGEVTDESTRTFLANYMEQFRTYIERVLTVIPRP